MTKSKHGRKIEVDHNACVGCLACVAGCPEKEFSFEDQGHRRFFSAPVFCAEECDLCRKVCPVCAIQLVSMESVIADTGPRQTWNMDLAPCRSCSSFFTTQRVLHHIRNRLESSLHLSPAWMEWTSQCPACRRREMGRRTLESLRRPA